METITVKKTRINHRCQQTKVNIKNEFVAFILSHGRPDFAFSNTWQTLKNGGYTGRILVVVDNEDKTIEQYREVFGSDNVVVFNKKDIAQRYPNADNFDDRKAVVYARNVCFEIAAKRKIKYFVQLDDDYIYFSYRADEKGHYVTQQKRVRSLDSVFKLMCEFLNSTPALAIATAQGGDFLGGLASCYFKAGWQFRRKIMNSWVCRTDRPFTFVGRMNEDVSTYVRLGVQGKLFFTFFQVMLQQVPTQSAPGGMTEVYTSSGTYLKSLYTVMMQPSSVKVGEMGLVGRRFHHVVNWKNTVPRLLPESCKK